MSITMRSLTIKKCFVLLLLIISSNNSVAQDCLDSESYYQYIKNNGQPHLEYVLDKIRSHSVVAIGEDHWIDAHPQFLCELITASAKDSTANIDAVAVEFGSERYQYLVDSLIKSPVYREDLVFKILQYTPDDLGNPYKEYADVFKSVWENNQKKPENLRTRILLVDPAYIQDYFDGKDYVYTGSRDDNMFDIIRNYIIKRSHIVFYAGAAHTLARINGTRQGDYYYNWPSAGFLLKNCYPQDVFIINLWGGQMGSRGYIENSKTRWNLIADGVIDKAFQKNGNKPVGFDLKDDFPLLRTETYFANPTIKLSSYGEKGSPYSEEQKFSDICDGIIFIKPVSEFNGIKLINIYDNEFIEKANKRTKGSCKTAEDILKTVKEWHPILQF